MSNTDTDALINDVQTNLDEIKRRTTESIAKTEKDTYAEILQGLVNLEIDFTVMNEANVRKFARFYAIIAEVRDTIDKYKGRIEIPMVDLERLGGGKVSVAEVRTIFMMVRYSEALKTLEKHKPELARTLFGAPVV